ncbi:MAG: thiamine phosphate synthase [Nitrososphaerales archaeon]|nr:thiamine phosphate synthase [Nitrososphaerales archaeon]
MNWRLSGLYFVLDASGPREKVLRIAESALRGGVNLLQVWYPEKDGRESLTLTAAVKEKTTRYDVPLIISNDFALAAAVGADGVHMDNFDRTPASLRELVGRDSIVGYTTGNDLDRVRWAEQRGADYISFCSIFPSISVADCEIVPLETVQRARELVKLPIFASGGINLSNAKMVLEAGVSGIAVISAIQRAKEPEETARKFRRIIDSVQLKAT